MGLKDSASGVNLLAEFLAAPPPRRVPIEIQHAALSRTRSSRFVMVLAGVAFLGIGIVTLLVNFPWHFYQDWKLQASDTATVRGHIVEVSNTDMYISRRYSPGPGTPVMRYVFDYQPSGAATMQGVCYSTGTYWRKGQHVTVRYRPENAALACVEGARLSESPSWMAIFIFYPLLGAAFVIGCLASRHDLLKLLKHGQITEATVTDIENIRYYARYYGWRDSTAYKITLKGESLPRLGFLTVSTVWTNARSEGENLPKQGVLTVNESKPDVLAYARDRMESKQPVYVLFDPIKPSKVILPETL